MENGGWQGLGCTFEGVTPLTSEGCAMTELPAVSLFTDGSCLGNPGPGGWAVLLRNGAGMEKLLSGAVPATTTSSRMELTALVMGLEALRRPLAATVYTDSQYVANGLAKWLEGWKAKGWRTAAGKPVENLDLWQRVDALRQQHAVATRWIKGHAGHPENERVDMEARRRAHEAAGAAPA